MKKTLELLWLPLLTCLFITACRPTVFMYEVALPDDFLPKNDVWDYIWNNLMGWSFLIWFLIDIIVVGLIWFQGHKWIEWLRHQPLTAKVLILYLLLGVIFVAGCLSIMDSGLSYGGWFAFPLTIMICLW